MLGSITLLRYVSFAEGISFLVLIYYAIYEKRILGNAEAIQVPGMVHGLLFILFCVVLFQVWQKHDWAFKKVAFAFVCSLLPFAPFYLERKLKHEETAK